MMHFPVITEKTGPVHPEGCASLDGLRTQALLTDLSRNSLTPVDSEEAPGTGGVQGDLGDLQGSSEQALGKSVMGGNIFLQQWLRISRAYSRTPRRVLDAVRPSPWRFTHWGSQVQTAAPWMLDSELPGSPLTTKPTIK